MKPPVLDLSGPALRGGLDSLLEAAGQAGGIGTLIAALRAKAGLFAELAGAGRARALDPASLLALANFMPSVRRRIGAWIDANGFGRLPGLLDALLDPAAPLELRWQHFLGAFPADRTHRFVRDLGAELLHFTAPNDVPLMCRWIWDAGTGTGMLREIWYSDPARPEPTDIADDPACFAALTAELGGFLREHGVFRDLALVQDLLMAHLYAGYINDRGGTFLKSDFIADDDPLVHTRRMLGLDALGPDGLRARVKLPRAAVPPAQLGA